MFPAGGTDGGQTAPVARQEPTPFPTSSPVWSAWPRPIFGGAFFFLTGS